MKHIYTHDNIAVLHSIQNILALNGVKAFVKNEDIMVAGPSHGINNIFLELWILNDQDFEKASSLIETEVDNPVAKVSWVCGKCGEENDGSFEICWKCQSVPGKE